MVVKNVELQSTRSKYFTFAFPDKICVVPPVLADNVDSTALTMTDETTTVPVLAPKYNTYVCSSVGATIKKLLPSRDIVDVNMVKKESKNKLDDEVLNRSWIVMSLC